ncbi:AAA family ATPase, partial [Campylobacter fetus]
IEQLKQAEQRGFKPKGIFLVGIPGTGKTFFPTCLSGELKRPLIMLNLEQLKEAGNPINQLNKVFEFLNK